MIDDEYSSRDFSELKLKSDHMNRPMWVCPDLHVYLETYNPYYQQACDFMIAIADPVSRAKYIHEYKLTSYSLYAAASLGLRTDDIVSALDYFSKCELSSTIKQMINKETIKCGKVRIVLKKTRYFFRISIFIYIKRITN